MKKFVYFFCVDKEKDRVGPNAFDACRRHISMEESDIRVDDMATFRHVDSDGNLFCFVPTRDVVSHDYGHYLPIMNGHFGDFDLAGIVNWHEGNNAPDSIFCVHTTGDVPSGTFGPADAKLTTATAIAIDRCRVESGLDEWQVLPEATHFSGIQYGSSPSVITEYPVPVIDIEIGSSPDYWFNQPAIDVLARSLIRVPESVEPDKPSIIFFGGVHFESSLRAAVIDGVDDERFAYSHHLANQWVVSGGYDSDAGIEMLRIAANSICGGIDGVIFHEGLKGVFKNVARNLGTELGIPAIKHKRLRDGIGALNL